MSRRVEPGGLWDSWSSGHCPLSGHTTTASPSLPHMALSLVEGSVVSPFLRFAEAPAGFLSTVDFISNIRGHVYRRAEPQQFGICVSRESSTEVGGPEQLGQSHDVFEDPSLCVFLLCHRYSVLPCGHTVIAEAPGITP